MKPEIRPGTRGDAVILSDIAGAAKDHWGYPQSWLKMWQKELTVTPQYIAQHPVYVAIYDGSIAGFVALTVGGREAEIDHLWVLPEYMGKGIGRHLLQRALRHCASVGVEQLRVVSDPNAKEFYLRLGAVYRGQVDSTPAPRTLPVLYFNIAVAGPDEKEET